MVHVHPLTESHPSSSPSKDQSVKNRRLSPGTIMFRKTLAMLTVLCAMAFIVIYKPPKTPLSSDEPSNGTDGSSRTTKVKNKPIRLIAILGERNSGTRWTFEYVPLLFMLVFYLLANAIITNLLRFVYKSSYGVFQSYDRSSERTYAVQTLVSI
jgi:hypothetical protein